jgi:hypothetical protein
MQRSDLDLRFSIFEGDAPGIGTLVLYIRLCAGARRLRGPLPECVVLCRDQTKGSAPWIDKSTVSEQDAVRLETVLRAAGFPTRAPRVVADEGLLGGGRSVILEATIRGLTTTLSLSLECGGFSGDDAEPMRAVFDRIAGLAPDGRRPVVQDLMDRLVVGRRRPVSPRRFRDDFRFQGSVQGGSIAPFSRDFLTEP